MGLPVVLGCPVPVLVQCGVGGHGSVVMVVLDKRACGHYQFC